jgi:hypothetical protein
MLRKTLIALVATAAIGTVMAGTAEAKHKHHHGHHLNIDLGYGGFGGYGYGSPYYADYDDYCGWRVIKIKKWNKWQHQFVIKHKKVWSCY